MRPDDHHMAGVGRVDGVRLCRATGIDRLPADGAVAGRVERARRVERPADVRGRERDVDHVAAALDLAGRPRLAVVGGQRERPVGPDDERRVGGAARPQAVVVGDREPPTDARVAHAAVRRDGGRAAVADGRDLGRRRPRGGVDLDRRVRLAGRRDRRREAIARRLDEVAAVGRGDARQQRDAVDVRQRLAGARVVPDPRRAAVDGRQQAAARADGVAVQRVEEQDPLDAERRRVDRRPGLGRVGRFVDVAVGRRREPGRAVGEERDVERLRAAAGRRAGRAGQAVGVRQEALAAVDRVLDLTVVEQVVAVHAIDVGERDEPVRARGLGRCERDAVERDARVGRDPQHAARARDDRAVGGDLDALERRERAGRQAGPVQTGVGGLEDRAEVADRVAGRRSGHECDVAQGVALRQWVAPEPFGRADLHTAGRSRRRGDDRHGDQTDDDAQRRAVALGHVIAPVHRRRDNDC